MEEEAREKERESEREGQRRREYMDEENVKGKRGGERAYMW